MQAVTMDREFRCCWGVAKEIIDVYKLQGEVLSGSQTLYGATVNRESNWTSLRVLSGAHQECRIMAVSRIACRSRLAPRCLQHRNAATECQRLPCLPSKLQAAVSTFLPARCRLACSILTTSLTRLCSSTPFRQHSQIFRCAWLHSASCKLNTASRERHG